MSFDLFAKEGFESRHNGPREEEIKEMLSFIKADSVAQLIEQTVPASIRLERPLELPEPLSEQAFLKQFKDIASQNKVMKSYIGLGYYETNTPTVIQRNILENPGWYTAYTPYQAEIAQGRLEALINFQTMVIDLTGMEVANASLLDEGTAAAEAMSMFTALRKGPKKKANTFFVDENVFPQTLDLLRTRTEPIGITLEVGPVEKLDVTRTDLFGMLVQYPNGNGHIENYQPLFEAANENSVFVAVAADLLALTLLKAPGTMGADAVIGTSQRLGIPMGYGGPHAAYFATRADYKRQLPGRIIGVSKDRNGKAAYRMALQTREQHIRREKATSNICTAQVLLAVMAGMYAVYHGPDGLKKIAQKVHGYARLFEQALASLGFAQENGTYFDTLKVRVESQAQKESILALGVEAGMNFRAFETPHIGISFNETDTPEELDALLAVWQKAAGKQAPQSLAEIAQQLNLEVPAALQRSTPYLEHEVFNKYRAEHDMLRYIKRLENKDISLVHSMISLGSCTMKLNATTEMIPLSWPELGALHPFAPTSQTQGYAQIFEHLEAWLKEITRFEGVSLQPNSGAQGEYSGLMVIRAYHQSRNDHQRTIALIPSSAHGTNPASAVMAGMKVVIVQCDDKGNIDLADLRAKAEQHSSELAALMVTYPSTHGVFEEDIIEICQVVHEHGGQVYMDGANMNAQVGLTSPASIGADVCHLNLHKTFCIPHGGGGPGMGPICVAKHLAPFLPSNVLVPTGGQQPISAISAAPWGSASILTISYAYIAMMGGQGLTRATELAILNANYIKEKLAGHFEVLYTGKNGRSAHEMIIDCRDFKKVNVEVEDIAKRLMDYGFHAPTVSFPVAGTMMIEPTESESKDELDRFCDAMIAIRAEIAAVERDEADVHDNVLKNAPHTAEVVLSNEWAFPYSREAAAHPLPFVKESKVWPTVSRIDSAFGDRNLICSCIPVEMYAETNQEAETLA